MLFASTVNSVADEGCNNNRTKLLLLKHIRTTAGEKNNNKMLQKCGKFAQKYKINKNKIVFCLKITSFHFASVG